MKAFEIATKFFHACESLQGFEGCRPFTSQNASFSAQSEPIAELETIEQYANWLQSIGSSALKGCSYQLYTSSFNEKNRKAVFFGAFSATHTGEGAPLPPTNKTTHSEYVYVLSMDSNDKVEHMTKVWNAPWALRELGWV